MKKILAILLSLALVICMLPASAVTAFAADEPATPTSPVKLTSDMISLSWTTKTYTGDVITPPEVTVKSGESSYTDFTVTVDPAEIKNAGEYKITVKPNGTTLNGDAITKTVIVNPADFSKATITYTGSTLKDSFTGKDGSTKFADLANNAEVALPSGSSITVTGTGIVKAFYQEAKLTKKDANSIRITVAKVTGLDNNVIGPPDKFIDIDLTTSLSGYKIIGSGKDGAIPDQTYNGGNALKPTVYVVPKSNTGGSTTGRLTENKDYTLTYQYNTNAGYTATVTAKGIGAYSETISETFYIVGKNIDKLSISGFNTTKGEKPSFEVKDGSTVLVEGTDYRINSWDSSSVGSSAGRATLEGIGNYTETKTVSYKVVDEKYVITASDVTCQDKTVLYTGSKQDITTTVVVDGKKLTKGSDYTLVYYDNDATEDKNKAVDPKNVSTYSVFLQGKGNYAVKSSSEKGLYLATFTIQPISLDRITVNFSSSTKYDSSSRAYVPKVSLKASNGAVIPTTDYDVRYYRFNSSSSYSRPYVVVTLVEKGKKGVDQTEVSTGSLTGGTGDRKDQIEEDYKGATIDQNNSKNISVTFDKAYYKDSSEKDGKANVKISNGNTINYVGERIYLDLSVYDSDSRRYLESYEYTVTYKNSSNRTVSYMYDADTYTVIIESTSNYENRYNRNFKVEKTFKITGNDISGYTVTLDKNSVNATGYAITLPKVTSVASGSTKLSTSQYTVSYKDSTDKTVTRIIAPGTYKVVVTGAGKYSGTTYATFRVIGLAQSITGVKSSYKMYPNSNTLQLTPSATEGSFTYTSSDSSIASVSSTGVVTAYKAGRAKITITTTGNTKYDPATFSTVIKVYPKKAVMTRKPWTTAKKGQIKVRWNKQDNVTRYEVRYSRAKNFAKGTYITKKVNAAQNDYTTQSTTISKLKSGYKYYVKVRAVKEVYNDNGKMITYYGTWSNWRSVVVK